jgi:hypothetical protein|tara:strand:- start:1044 stop:1460 length:417 start_codon:yes stop_codon:yes gene_type:complete
MNILETTSKFLLTSAISYTIRNPLEALAATAIISNPTTRGLTIKIGQHIAKQAIVDLGFYSRLIGTNVVAPVGRRAIAQITATASTPVVAIPATALAAAAVGAAISSSTVVAINRETNNTGASSMWSPFGGMGFGTVV